MAFSRGDIVWIEFNPQAGREIQKCRPALILSPKKYNQQTGMAVVCPITNTIKGYPFEVILPDNTGVTGVILSDQIKSIDMSSRAGRFICKADSETIASVQEKINLLLNIGN